MTTDKEIDAILKQQFAALPAPVQRAILSADVQQYLRDLANSNKLHLDQWQILENQVMLTLLGLKSAIDISVNLQKALGVEVGVATDLANGISEKIFTPIREELERQLEHPEAKAAEVSDVEAARNEVLAKESVPERPKEVVPPPPPVAPATPPTPPPTGKAIRETLPSPTAPNAASHERKDIEGDPYREQVK